MTRRLANLRPLTLVLTATLAFSSAVASIAQADTPRNRNSEATAADRLLASAQREVEIAELRLRRYRLFEYPLEIRRLRSAIKVAEAELETFGRQVKEYEQFTKFKYSSPLFASLEYARLNHLKAETTLADLREEKHLLEQDKHRRLRLLQLELDAAIHRLDTLTGNGETQSTRHYRAPIRNRQQGPGRVARQR